MIYASILLFTIALLLGVGLLYRISRKNPLPKIVGYTHGVLGFSGFVLLSVALMEGAGSNFDMRYFSLMVFAPALLIGIFVLIREMRKKQQPFPVIVAHAGLALIAFIILLVSLM